MSEVDPLRGGMMKSIANFAPLALSLLCLSACASAAELRARDEAACASYGFQPGTPDFGRCLQQESLARNYGAGPQLGLGLGVGVGRW
jgi:hypothetical protein